MGENVPQSVEVPVGLETFGSLVTEMAPSDLPEGVSPDCQDVVFVPGSVSSRPGLRRIYSQLPLGATVTYIKTYIQPNGEPLNLVLDSSGGLWKEDIFNSPGLLTKIGQVSAGSYCTSITAFGREYMSFHDGINGTDIPRQFDGTNFDRVSQGGPGAPPNLANYSFLPATLQNTGPGGAIAIVSAVTADLEVVTVPSGHRRGDVIDDWTIDIYNSILFTSGAAHGLVVGSVATVAGSSDAQANKVWTVTAVPSPTTFKVAWGSTNVVNGLGGNIVNNASSVTRNNNVVTATTLADHNFPVGFQVVISGIPGANIIGISAAVRLNGVTTITTAAAHGLQAGESININGTADPTFNIQTTVFSIIDATHFSYLQTGAADVTLGAGGNVQDVWNGTFVIQSVPTARTFNYFQIGINSQNNTVGAATVLGRVVLGQRSCVVLFQTRNGFITAPSPATAIASNGGQSLYITNIPIGPANVIARILAFTPAGGANFFYIPVPAIFNGMLQSTSTVINDNTSNSVLLDFSDNTLQAATPIDVKGSNLFEMGTLGLPIGVFYYASRLAWWGQKNKIPNLLNMGFDGGYLAGIPTIPLGWTVVTPGGFLDSAGDFATGWEITGDGTANPKGQISQTGFRDEFSVAILQPGTLYTLNLYAVLKSISANSVGILTGEFYSPTAGVLASATLLVSQIGIAGRFHQINFNAALPQVIPADIVFRISISGMDIGRAILIDEMEIYPTLFPSTKVFSFSYVNRPESYDLITGILGSADDDSPIQTCFEYHSTLNFLTSRGLHETKDSSSSEPSGWSVTEISNRCGCASPRACDSGENFAAWVSSPTSYPATGRGLYIYTGGAVYKISQEIQPDFDQINPNAAQSIWAKNDAVNRRFYLGLPMGSATAPNLIYPLDYRELDTALEIAEKAPVKISFTGKMICSDLSRKWTRWNISANCAEMVHVAAGGVTFTIGGGNGQSPVTATGSGLRANSYFLDGVLLTDDDFGQIVPYYNTYFFVNHEMEAQLQIGLHRKLYKRYSAYMTGVGLFNLIPFANTLSNPWPAPPQWPLNSTQFNDFGDGLNITAERVSFRIGSIPLPGQTDNSFNVGKFIVTLCQEPVAPIRFGAI